MWQVYVIQIREKWHPLVASDLQVGKRCFYVGVTGKDPLERLDEHLRGINSRGKPGDPSAKVFKKMRAQQGGRSLIRGEDVYFSQRRARGPFDSREEAESVEKRTIETMRAQGHEIYGA